MITRRGLPIQLIVADSEPLISLAACDRLELLREFRCPVRVPDVVQAECLRHPDKIGAADLQQWFGALDCPAVELPTPFLTAWHQAIAEEASEPDRHTSAGIGDAAVAWLLRQAQLGTVLDSPTLLLTEDGPFGDGVVRDRFPEVQVLSTRALLRTLENVGRIPSAQSVIDEIARAGRQLARYMADRPGRPSSGTRTTWATVLDDLAEQAKHGN